MVSMQILAEMEEVVELKQGTSKPTLEVSVRGREEGREYEREGGRECEREGGGKCIVIRNIILHDVIYISVT